MQAAGLVLSVGSLMRCPAAGSDSMCPHPPDTRSCQVPTQWGLKGLAIASATQNLSNHPIQLLDLTSLV